MLKTAAPLEKSTLEEFGDGKGDDGIGGVEIAKNSGKLKGQKRLSPKNCLSQKIPRAKNRKNH